MFLLFLSSAPLCSNHTAKADIQFTFPVESKQEEELRLILDWKPARMSDMATEDVEGGGMKNSAVDDAWEEANSNGGNNGAAAGRVLCVVCVFLPFFYCFMAFETLDNTKLHFRVRLLYPQCCFCLNGTDLSLFPHFPIQARAFLPWKY